MDITICPYPRVKLASFIELSISDDTFKGIEPQYQLNTVEVFCLSP